MHEYVVSHCQRVETITLELAEMGTGAVYFREEGGCTLHKQSFPNGLLGRTLFQRKNIYIKQIKAESGVILNVLCVVWE